MPHLLVPAIAATALLAFPCTVRAQESGLPGIQPLTCEAANSLIGKPQHESEASIEGDYDSSRDSTYLIAYRRTFTIRTFIPWSIAVRQGRGPFTVDQYQLGVTVNSEAEAIARQAGQLTGRLVLDDFTAFELGPVTVGSLTMQAGVLSRVPLSVQVPASSWLRLLRAHSAVLSWGKWHADLETSDIGALRGLTRVLACAPGSLPQIATVGFTPRPPDLATTRVHPTDAVVTSGSHFHQGFSGPNAPKLDFIVTRISCPAADSLLGTRLNEDAGLIAGRYDEARDSTLMVLELNQKGSSFDFYFNTAMKLPGPGPFRPIGLGLRFVVLNNISTDRPWSDTMQVTLVLDDSMTLRLGHLRLNQPNGECCRAPLQVTALLTPAAQLAFLQADKARLSWGGVALDMGIDEIGMYRAFQRALLCAPASLDPHLTVRAD